MPQGYPLRSDGDCPAPSYPGGGTWGDWQTCCPPNTYCPQGQYNSVCFQSGAQSTLSQCANSTWDLYVEDNYYFCCEEGRIGFTSLLNDSKGFFGCSTKAKFDSQDMNSLTIRVPGTGRSLRSHARIYPNEMTPATPTPTASPTSTISTASTTATTSSTSTSTTTSTTAASSGSGTGSTNTGAIAGGVVGGVCGVALIAVLIWLVFRNRAKASKNQEKPLSPGSDQQNVGFYRDSHVVPAHLQGNQGRSPFQSPPGSDKPSELPPDTGSASPSELPTEYRPVPAELPSR